jgi:adenylate cyclase
MSHSIMDAIQNDQQPILITDLGDDSRFKASESVRITGMRSAMVAPLLGATRLFGMIYVDNPRQSKAFTQEELNVFALVAAQAGSALDNAYAHKQLAEGAIQRSALERFLSPDVVQMIAENPGGVKLGGVNQKVSVMFADIRGFTSLSERMEPEKIVEILNEYFTRVTDVIFDNGGTLDKYIGDAVMAVFGAPISKGNDAANAVKAAVELQRLVLEVNRDAAARQWPELEVGIGINTGIVTAGNIGSPRRLDYTVIGDAVNTASRLMSNAKGFQILISESTDSEIGKKWKRESLPAITVKGKKKPINIFEVEWKK